MEWSADTSVWFATDLQAGAGRSSATRVGVRWALSVAALPVLGPKRLEPNKQGPWSTQAQKHGCGARHVLIWTSCNPLPLPQGLKANGCSVPSVSRTQDLSGT